MAPQTVKIGLVECGWLGEGSLHEEKKRRQRLKTTPPGPTLSSAYQWRPLGCRPSDFSSPPTCARFKNSRARPPFHGGASLSQHRTTPPPPLPPLASFRLSLHTIITDTSPHRNHGLLLYRVVHGQRERARPRTVTPRCMARLTMGYPAAEVHVP